jgi:hypothetical protein
VNQCRPGKVRFGTETQKVELTFSLRQVAQVVTIKGWETEQAHGIGAGTGFQKNIVLGSRKRVTCLCPSA